MRALHRLDRAIEGAAVAIFVTSCFFIVLNVLNRYLVLGVMRDLAKDWEQLRPLYFAIRDMLGSIVVTADEVPGLLLVWIAFLGAYLALRREGHIAFDLLVARLKPPMRRAAMILNSILIGGFLIMLLWQSIRMIAVSGATEIETASIAQGWFMLILPLSAALMLLAVAVRLRDGLFDRSSGPEETGG